MNSRSYNYEIEIVSNGRVIKRIIRKATPQSINDIAGKILDAYRAKEPGRHFVAMWEDWTPLWDELGLAV